MANVFYAGEGESERYSGNPGVDAEREPGRTPYRKDFARLLHAPALRRLQGKTQLFPGVESDFFRNRLTHSLEVAQIAKGIASRLNATAVQEHFPGSDIDEDIVEFAAIAHDLGHAPFGHNGEKALDELMREFGGFEGNAQTLRILTAVEQKFTTTAGGLTGRFGLDLTYRTLASVLKYDKQIPAVRRAGAKLAKGYYASEAKLVSEIKKRVAPGLPAGATFKTIECAIMDIADDIAYSTYDLEDSLHAGFVTPMKLACAIANDASIEAKVKIKSNKTLKEAGYDEVREKRELLDVIAQVFGTTMPTTAAELLADRDAPVLPEHPLLINQEAWKTDRTFADDSLSRTRFTARRVGNLIAAVQFVPNKAFPALSSVSMRREELLQVEVLKHLNYELVIRSPRLAVVEHRGKELVSKIFKTLVETDGALLAEDWRDRHTEAVVVGVGEARRVVCDYVACMTDRYAAELHARLFGEGSTIFKPL